MGTTGRAPASTPSGALRRSLRLPAFTLGSAGVALAAHLLAHGDLPDPAVLMVVALVVAVVGAALGAPGRRRPARLGRPPAARPLWQQVIGIAAVQVAVHVAMLQPHHMLLAGSDAMAGQPGGRPGDLSPAMLAAHGAAVVLLAWWLRRGEQVAVSGARRLLRRLVAAFPVAGLPGIAPRVLVAGPPAGSAAGRRPGTLPGRGPPLTA